MKQPHTGWMVGLLLLLLGGCAFAPAPHNAQGETGNCPDPGLWVLAGQSGSLNTHQLAAQIGHHSIVLLGERHDQPAEHQWQLDTLRVLYRQYPGLAVGFEMFNRDQQPILDDWSSGRIDTPTLLKRTHWHKTWGFPASLYRPILDFVHGHRIPAIALNVPPKVIQRIADRGWSAAPAYLRDPAPLNPDYRKSLETVFREHAKHKKTAPTRKQLDKFVRVQTVWDRGMAQALLVAASRRPAPVVAIVGRGHLEYGYGIPHQLAALGFHRFLALLPHAPGDPCLRQSNPIAGGLYGLAGKP